MPALADRLLSQHPIDFGHASRYIAAMNWLYSMLTIPSKLMLILKMLSEISARLKVIEAKIKAAAETDS